MDLGEVSSSSILPSIPFSVTVEFRYSYATATGLFPELDTTPVDRGGARVGPVTRSAALGVPTRTPPGAAFWASLLPLEVPGIDDMLD